MRLSSAPPAASREKLRASGSRPTRSDAPPPPQHPAGHFPGVTRSSRGCSKCRGRLSRALLASHRASAPLQPSEPGGADCYADCRHRGVSASKRNFPGSRWGRGREEPAAPVHPAAQVSLVPAALWAPGALGGSAPALPGSRGASEAGGDTARARRTSW